MFSPSDEQTSLNTNTMNNLSQQIISINLDGKHSNLIKLEEIIRDNQPIICLLQDVPRTGPSSLSETFFTIAENYDPIYHGDDLRRLKRIENLILVDSERIVVHKVHLYNGGSRANALGISINRVREETVETSSSNLTDRVDYGDMIIFSIYIRPRASHHEAKRCLEWIGDTSKNNEGHSRTIVMGDMNAAEASWGPIVETINNREGSDSHYRQIKLVRGRLVAKHFSKIKLTCLNRAELGPTYQGIHGDSFIDLAFVGNKMLRTWTELHLKKISERPSHKALILKSKGLSKTRFRKRSYRRIKAELICESDFIEAHLRCDQLCVNWKQLPRNRIVKRMDRLTSILYRSIELAQERVTTRVTKKLPPKSGVHRKGVLHTRVRNMIYRLRKQESRARGLLHLIKRQDMTNSNNNDNLRRHELVNNRKRLKLKMGKLRRAIIDNLKSNRLAETLNNSDNQDLWERVHTVERLFGRSTDTCASNASNDIKTQEDIERLADAKFPHCDRVMQEYVTSVYDRSKEAIRIDINNEEIITAVQNIKSKTYTSSEGIKMNVFFKALEFVADIVRTLMEMSFWIAYIPKRACMTQGTLIPKKAPGQFRIVHISSPLAALFELVALRRFEFRLEANRLNSPYQFGFSALVSRHDLMARVLEFFYSEYLKIGRKASGLIISLDIEGAFDNVNQDRLIQKLDRELANDPIKYWLASFVLNRRISIKTGNIKSQPREICLGVPQGSALGPILWNYMINDIDIGIGKPGKAELVRYADDIILIYNGDSNREAQLLLDKLVMKLGAINLNIRPEKCSVMGIRLGRRDLRKNSYHINGREIKSVDRMNILGIPITKKLKLDRKSVEHMEKLALSVKKLHSISRLGLVNSSKEWRILVDSYIKSRVMLNGWPILIIDHKACKWADDIMVRAFKTIFNWPNNISVKLVKLITGTLSCHEVVVRTAKLRTLSQFGKLYDFLLKIGQPGAVERMLSLVQGGRTDRSSMISRFNLETDIIRDRKHSDPTKPVGVKWVTNLQTEIENYGPTWILLDRNVGSMLAEITKDRLITQFELGRHSEYPISYFNSFALILKVVSDRTCNHRSLTLSEFSSILSALENSENRDWRVIQMRERMSDNGWRINKINHRQDQRLRQSIADKYKSITLRHDMSTIINDFNLWLAFNERSTDEREANQNQRPSYQVASLTEPYLLDYKRRNHLVKRNASDSRIQFLRCHTSITSALTTRLEVWQSITPNWLDGSKMLVLSGMTTNSSGQLEFGERVPGETCYLCENQEFQSTAQGPPGNWHGIHSSRVNANLVLHKTLECKALQVERERFLEQVRIEFILDRLEVNGRGVMDQILTNRRTCQRFLSFMVKCNIER